MSERSKKSSRAKLLVGVILSVVLVSTAPWWWSNVKPFFLKPPKPEPLPAGLKGPVDRQYSCDNFLGSWEGDWHYTVSGKTNLVCYQIEKDSPLMFSIVERARDLNNPSHILRTIYPATCEEDGTLTYEKSKDQTEMKIVNGKISLEATHRETHNQLAQGTMQKGSCPIPE
jgi:hypothetical protein